MYDSLVSIASWVIFSAMGLASLAFVFGTLWRSLQLTTARSHVDDGSEDPASRKIYEISLKSDRLAVIAGVYLLMLTASVILVFSSPPTLAALGLAAILLVVSASLRQRHAELEVAFHRHSGMTIQASYALVMDRPMSPPIPVRTDQSASLN